ncbi:MAG TPA: hypothetical protein VMH78_04065 [Thermoplasmata archaeon]|nr:hypothetical protein [Thermoplasmata archaeon]
MSERYEPARVGRPVTDLQERPAVPPMDTGGDERLGFQIAGALLVVVGWGLGVVANLAVHAAARGGVVALGAWRIGSALGPYAEIALGIGLATGAIGAGILAVARSEPRGPIVLPGYSY